jgi:hypothetical protein
VRHLSRVHSEEYRDGLDGYHGDLPITSRVWVAECSCGWTADSGVAIRTFRTRATARRWWRDHKRIATEPPQDVGWDLVPYEPSEP